MDITRRRFLAQVGTGFLAPMILGAQNKSGSRKPVIGSGEHTYEVTHDWGQLPADIQYGNTHGVCEDSQGQIYIHHTVYSTSEKPDSMVVFDPDGKFVKSWGKDFRGGAHGLYIGKEAGTEFLYLCDTQRGLMVKTKLNGEEVFTLGYPKESEAYAKPGPDGKPLKYSPTNLALAPNGDIYIGDGYGSSYLSKLADATHFNPFDDINVACVVEARTMRTDKFPGLEVIAGEFARRHVVAGGIVAKMHDDLVVGVHECNAGE